MPLTPGTRLGPYEIMTPIGAGGMGEVYRARDTRLNRDVAIKVLPFGHDSEQRARFEREAQAVAALSHPNIVSLFDTGVHDAHPYIVTELLTGKTLRESMRAPLPPRKAIEISTLILRGLAAAHQKGLVHRDLKPENIFLLADGQVKILDFGLAKTGTPGSGGLGESQTTAAVTDAGIVMGTVGYMAPEQVRGEAVDARTDLFAFGAVLYEVLSGQRAFRRDTSAETMAAILRDEPADLALMNQSLPPGLERIVRHCLEKNPEQRFQSARDLAFDLESLSISSGARVAATASNPGRRLPTAAGLAGFLAMLAVGILAGHLLWKSPAAALPAYRALTFGRGPIASARFAPDGQTILYAAAWDAASFQLFSVRAESPASSRLPLPEGGVESISASGNMLVLHITQSSLGWTKKGTLSETPLSGNALRDLVEDVGGADWAPDGRSMALVRAPDWKYRLEFPAGHVLYETTGWISHPRVSPAGDVVAFVDHPVFGDDVGSIATIDRSGKKTIVWQSAASSAQGIAWSTSGDEIWFTAGQGGHKSLYAVTRSGRQRAVLTNTGDMTLQDISHDGRVLFVQENARVGFLGLLPGETRERDLSGLDWSETPLLSDDGKTLVWTEQGVGGGPGNAVYLRHLDGSAPVRLGQGNGLGFSPDGKWVVMAVQGNMQPAPIALMPTGAGELKVFPRDTIDRESGDFVKFLPDGKRILFNGNEPGRPRRTFVQDLDGGPAKPVTAEGVVARVVSSDGASVLVRTPGGPTFAALAPLDGGPFRPIRGLQAGDRPMRWADDGHTLFVGVAPLGELTAHVLRVNVDTGAREPWRELKPADPAGMRFLQPNAISADGKTIIFLYNRTLAELYLAQGVK